MRDGELLVSESDYREAFQCFKAALNEVPEPPQDHHEATRAVTAIADCYYFLGQYGNAEQPLRDVLLLPDGAANPYIRLRRGQVFHHLGDAKAAAMEWTCAFLNGGYDVFAGETDCKHEMDAVLAGLQGLPTGDEK
jgi:hypothetical protein